MKTARPETEVSAAVVERARPAAGLETRSEAAGSEAAGSEAAAARTWVHYRP